MSSKNKETVLVRASQELVYRCHEYWPRFLSKGDNKMNMQPYVIRGWELILQWLSQISLFSISRRNILCIEIAALAFGLCLVSLSVVSGSGASALHTLSQSVLHLIGKIPFGEPFPP